MLYFVLKYYLLFQFLCVVLFAFSIPLCIWTLKMHLLKLNFFCPTLGVHFRKPGLFYKIFILQTL